MKVLVVAYQLSPYRGSEYSVAWNYIMEMGTEHSITILYGVNGDHMGDFDSLDEYRKLIGDRDITFVPIHCGFWGNMLNQLNKHGIFVYTFYLAYNLWHKRVFKKAQRLVRESNYDLIHFLGPIGYREPGYLWKLPLPYIWGPINGFANTKAFLLKDTPIKGRMKLSFRTFANTLQQNYSFRLRSALNACDRVLAATTETQQVLLKKYGIRAAYIPENGILDTISPEKLQKKDFKTGELILFWIGSIDERKALHFLLEALRVVSESCRWHLVVVGDGGLKNRMQELAEKYGIGQHISWMGMRPRKEVFSLLDSAHCHVITSCMEGNPTTIWEAMSRGVPTITFDHCGMHDTICEQCGIRIPLASCSQIVHDLACSIKKIAEDRELLEHLSYGALQCASKYLFCQRHVFFNKQFEQAIQHWRNSNK